MKVLLRTFTMNQPAAKSPPEKTPDTEDIKTVDTRRNIGYTLASMNNTPYRELQSLAKMCGVPRNLKKEVLKMVIRAKMNGDDEEVAQLLREVRRERIIKRNSKKALKEEKPEVKIQTAEEINNNQVKRPESDRPSVIKKVIHHLAKMRTNPNVTIQKTSTHTHYRALVKPDPWRFSFDSPSPESSESHKPVCRDPPKLIKLNGRNVRLPFQSNSQASCSTITKTQNQLGFTEVRNWFPPTAAMTVRETLLQQYRKNAGGGEHVRGIVENESYTGAIMRKQELMKFQPLPSFNSVYSSNVPGNNAYFYQAPSSSNDQTQLLPKPTPIYPYQPGEQQWLYGAFQPGIERSSTPFNVDVKYDGLQNCNNVPLANAEPFVQIHSTYSGFNEAMTSNNAPFAQASGSGVNPNTVSPSSPIVDVTKLSMETETSDDTDLGLLANMAVTKALEATDGTRNQQYNNGLLMLHDSLLNLNKEELVGSDSKTLSHDIPTWNNFLEQMSINLSPGITNNSTTTTCKYGCHMPCFNRQQQLDHEEHCLLQPMQCPVTSCPYVGQLRTITTHLLNDHHHLINSNVVASYMVDLTDGKCSFQMPQTWMNQCPKKVCFLQQVEGRLFLIKVIGNFDSMQAVIYAQYINDHHRWNSHLVFEVVRRDGVPFQYKGEVFPISMNPMHIISRRKCLIFNMNHQDWTLNSFMLHTKIYNFKY